MTTRAPCPKGRIGQSSPRKARAGAKTPARRDVMLSAMHHVIHHVTSIYNRGRVMSCVICYILNLREIFVSKYMSFRFKFIQFGDFIYNIQNIMLWIGLLGDHWACASSIMGSIGNYVRCFRKLDWLVDSWVFLGLGYLPCCPGGVFVRRVFRKFWKSGISWGIFQDLRQN